MSSTKHTKEEIENWIINWVSDQLSMDQENIDIDEPFVNLGMSSRQAVFLSGELSDFLKMEEELSPSLIWDFPTISAISKHLSMEETQI